MAAKAPSRTISCVAKPDERFGSPSRVFFSFRTGDGYVGHDPGEVLQPPFVRIGIPLAKVCKFRDFYSELVVKRGCVFNDFQPAFDGRLFLTVAIGSRPVEP